MKILRRITSINPHTIVSHIFRCIFILTISSALLYFFLQPFSHSARQLVGEVKSNIYIPLFIEGIFSTIKMVIITALIATLLGTCYAWMLSNYTFFLSRICQKFLLLPLVLPPLLTGIAFVAFFGIGGFTHKITGSFYIDVMTSSWLYIIMILHTFPYAYSIAQGFYNGEYQDLKKTYTSLGVPRMKRVITYFRSYLPYSLRGISIISMEVLGEFALSSYFGYVTLNTLIYSEWRGKGNLYTAVSIGFISFILALSLVRISTFFHASANHTKYKKISLLQTPTKTKQILLCSSFLVPLLFVVCIPLVVFIRWFILLGAPFMNVLSDFSQSFSISAFTSVLVTGTGLICAYVLCFMRKNKLDWVFSLGYALPSSLIGVSFILLFGFLGERMGTNFFSVGTPLIIAYVLRYMNFSYSTLSVYFYSLGKNITNTFLSLGLGSLKLFFLQIGMLRRKLFIIFLLVFIEVSKDLGITIVLRPFNFNNLATRIYELVHDERSIDTAPYALALIALNVIVFLWYSPQKMEKYDVA